MGATRGTRLICAVTLVWLAGLGTAARAQNPVPLVNLPLVPTSTPPGGPSFTLTVNGTGFVAGSVVNWNGAALATTFVSGSQLTAIVPSANIATAGTATVAVQNPGAPLSNTAYFHITSPETTVSLVDSEVSDNSVPVWVAVGDFNGDGKLDLVSSNLSSNTVGVLLGKGDGTFQAPVNSFAGILPYSVAVGDFDGDGKLDLAVGDIGSNSLDILLGNDNGTFQYPISYPQAAAVWFVVTGDFDHDGNLDLAFVDQPNNTLFIYLGNGTGTFRFGSSYSVGSGPSSLAIGDFNSDGTLDLAVANANDNNIGIWLGRGDGTFQLLGNFAAGIQPIIATADFNGDGKLDFAVFNRDTSSVNVYLGAGNGTFALATMSPTGVGATQGFEKMAIADINGDGKLDIAIPDSLENSVSVLLGNGDGTFQPAVNFGVGTNPNAVAIGDFDGDGKPDLAVANASNPGSSTVSILLQQNTTAGNSVSVNLNGSDTTAGGATVTFSSVTTGGNTTETATGSGTPPPSGFGVGSPAVYYDLSTTATFTGPVTVCLNYAGITFSSGMPQLFHYEGGAWVDVTTSTDTTNHIVCGTVTSFSPFAIFQPTYQANVQPPIASDGTSVFTAKRGVVPVKFTLTLAGASTCQLPAASLSLFSESGSTMTSINQNVYEMPSDSGSNFRVDSASCQYVYNLGTSSLGTGTYVVQISIGGNAVGSGTFGLK